MLMKTGWRVAIISMAMQMGLGTATIAQAQQTIEPALKTRLISDIEYIATIYQQNYAPLDWKTHHVQLDLNHQLEEAKKEINQASSVYDYRQAVVRFINSMQDYHVAVSFESTEKASLPLMLKTVEGKTIIIDIDRDKLSATSFPFQVGDQVLAMNDTPIEDIRADLIKDMRTTAPLTDQALVDMMLTARAGRRNLKIPQNTVTLKILQKGQTTPTHHEINWEYKEEHLPGRTQLAHSNSAFGEHIFIPDLSPKEKGSFLLKPLMINPILTQFKDSFADTSLFGLGQKKSFLPSFGEKIWEAEESNTFDAYIYINEQNKPIGVVRISSYLPNEDDPKGRVKAAADFAKVIQKMQKFTSGLIIDQLNNPGGSVFYLYSLASMLTNKSLFSPKHRMIINNAMIKECLAINTQLNQVKNDEDARKLIEESADGYPVNYQFAVSVQNACRFLNSEYKAGKRLSDPYYIAGVDRINPSSVVQYTKPIVILVNELDFSGGDFFPATLQDNLRAKIVGTRTSGAGGYVHPYQFPNHLGVDRITVTESLADRINHQPIENLGITPDVELKMTVEDYSTQFSHYVSEVKKIINAELAP